MRKLIVFVITFVFILFFLFKGENVFFITLRPVQNLLYGSKNIESEESLCRDLKMENVLLRKLQAENKVLREYLNFSKKIESNFVLTNIIGQKSEVGINWFLLDQGENQKIKPGLAVVDQQGVLIGKIIETKKFVSYLMPIFDQRFSLGADIITQKNDIKEQSEEINYNSETISGIIEGEYGSILKMKYIPLDKEVKVGDSVVTSGTEENIGWGIMIGQVVKINKKPNDIFQEIVVEPLLNPDFRLGAVILPFSEQE